MARLRIFVAACLCGVVAQGAGAPAQTTAAPRRFVLLVGVTRYPNLEEHWSLNGPANDAVLLKALLQSEPFKIPASDIAVLAGWPADQTRRPTKANIAREFGRLAQQAHRGDQVFIAMAGHGSQQPAPKGAVDEPDGLDELFLPADITKWDGKVGQIPNAIVDDEIHAWLDAIRNAGAFVWIVFDSCHSGTMTRGGNIERARQISPRDLGIPDQAMSAATSAAAARSRGGPEARRPMLGLTPDAGNLVAMYAAHESETTPEKNLPEPSGAVHGLFTYTIDEVLRQATTPMTYRDLAARVSERYRSLGRVGPTPTFEGGGLDQEVLGQHTWPDRPQLLLHHDVKGALELQAGDLNGLHSGDVLAVYPPAGTTGAERVIGHVAITTLGPLTSAVRPEAYAGMPAPRSDQLVDASRCAVAYHNVGDLRLRVALLPEEAETDSGRRQLLHANAARLGQVLREIETTSNGMARATDNPRDAQWFLTVLSDGRVGLLSSSVVTTADTSEAAALSGTDNRPFLVGTLGEAQRGSAEAAAPSSARPLELSQKLGEVLQRIGRAQALLHMAKTAGTDTTDQVARLELTMTRRASAQDTTESPVRFTEQGVTFTEGDRVIFQLHNTGREPIDVTLLFIDSGFGIEAVYPSGDQLAANVIAPGDTLRLGPYPINARTIGIEGVVALAVAATKPPINFTLFAQSGLERTRGAKGANERGESDRGASTPLGQLLKFAMDNQGTTRGLNGSESRNFTIQSLSWRTLPR